MNTYLAEVASLFVELCLASGFVLLALSVLVSSVISAWRGR